MLIDSVVWALYINVTDTDSHVAIANARANASGGKITDSLHNTPLSFFFFLFFFFAAS